MWKILYMFVKIAKSTRNCAHVHVLLVTLPIQFGGAFFLLGGGVGGGGVGVCWGVLGVMLGVDVDRFVHPTDHGEE